MSSDPGVQIKSRAVVVGDGSGVVVAAMTNDYCYVLTAAHNVSKDRKTSNEVLLLADIVITFADGISKNPCHVVRSETEDAALLLIWGEIVAPISFSELDFTYQDAVTIVGYPELRRSQGDNRLRLYNGRIEDIHTNHMDVSTNTFSSQTEVMGVSGGGVYKRLNEDWVLIGIEYSMEGEESEGHAWLKCIQMRIFAEIINGQFYDGKPLAPILPPFLADFSSLIDSSFQLHGFENPDIRGRVRNVLHDLAYEMLGNACPTPHALMRKFGDKLLVVEDPLFRLADKKLWISWVELLVLSVILDGRSVIDENYVDELRKKRLLLYSGSAEEWLMSIRKILRSDLRGLDKDGAVFISNNCIYPPVKHRTRSDLSKIVPDITRPRNKSIDITSSDKPFIPRTVVHLDGLHAECLVRQEEIYHEIGEMNLDDAIEIIRKAYFEAIE